MESIIGKEVRSVFFCHHNETIRHLFFHYHFIKSIWSMIQIVSTLYPPTSVANIFSNWLHWVDHRFNVLIRVGQLSIIFSLWICRNDKVFNDINYSLM